MMLFFSAVVAIRIHYVSESSFVNRISLNCSHTTNTPAFRCRNPTASIYYHTYVPRVVVRCLPVSREVAEVLFRPWSMLSPAARAGLGCSRCSGWRSPDSGTFSECGRLAGLSLLRSLTGDLLGGLASRFVPVLRLSVGMWLALEAASLLAGTTTFDRYGGDLSPTRRSDASAGGGAASLWDGFQFGGLRCRSCGRPESCTAGTAGIDAKLASRSSILSRPLSTTFSKFCLHCLMQLTINLRRNKQTTPANSD